MGWFSVFGFQLSVTIVEKKPATPCAFSPKKLMGQSEG
jgi:hypothetical protein